MKQSENGERRPSIDPDRERLAPLERLVERALAAEDWPEVTRGLIAITDTKDPEVVPWLIAVAATYEPSEGRQLSITATRALVDALRRMRDERAVDLLTRFFRAHPDRQTSHAAAIALGEVGSVRAATVLRESLSAESARERELALRALKFAGAMDFGAGGLTREERAMLRRDPSARVRWFAWMARARVR